MEAKTYQEDELAELIEEYAPGAAVATFVDSDPDLAASSFTTASLVAVAEGEVLVEYQEQIGSSIVVDAEVDARVDDVVDQALRETALPSSFDWRSFERQFHEYTAQNDADLRPEPAPTSQLREEVVRGIREEFGPDSIDPTFELEAVERARFLKPDQVGFNPSFTEPSADPLSPFVKKASDKAPVAEQIEPTSDATRELSGSGPRLLTPATDQVVREKGESFVRQLAKASGLAA
ncbi:MAG: hypothetical protein H6619_06220 [Deltaproteobacteria bacterium]|nr:hypothetical protein [Deltaproteobacteria bacterium]